MINRLAIKKAVSWIFQVTLVFVAWFLVLLILLGVFNPRYFYCSYSMYWREIMSMCSLTSMIEGSLSALILVFLKVHRESSIVISLASIVIVIALLDVRGRELTTMLTAFEVSYGWKILGIFSGVYLAKLWSKKNS